MRMYQPLYTESFTWADEKVDGSQVVAVAGDSGTLQEVTRLRSYAAQLQKEVDSRTHWALELEKNFKELQASWNRLHAEFDERGQWALGLDNEIRSQREHIAMLQAQLAEAQTQSEHYRRQLAALVESLRSPSFLARKITRAILDKLRFRST
jgi:septal ring factor EnvC (AmiA/AmiB activator)